MPSSIQQAHIHCNRCNRPTLHQCAVQEINHVAHLVGIICCCGLWAPIWLLLVILKGMEPLPPFFCTQCGHAAGLLTPEQEAVRVKWQAEQDQIALAKVVAKEQRYHEWRKRLQASLASLYRGSLEEVPKIPGRIDRLLKAAAGEGNEILHWFFRAVACCVPLAIVAVAVAWIVQWSTG